MRTLLIILMAFVGLTATLIGMLLIAYPVITAYGFPLEFLRPALVKSHVLPGVMLVITGSINLAALSTGVQRSRTQYTWSLGSGLLTVVWVVIHSVLLQAIPWLYFTYFICGVSIVLLAWQLKGKWAV